MSINPIINYKRLTANGFNKEEYGLKSNIIEHHLNYDGQYIKDDLLTRLNRDSTDTTVINAGVGSGKSSLGYDLMIDYAKSGYIVIVASPFILLTHKDFKELTTRAENTGLSIVSYSSLTKNNTEEYSIADIHVVTIHLLLGDPGKDLAERGGSQAKHKIEYQDKIREYSKKTGKKIILFFDEIHESASSFQYKLVRNLGKWSTYVHKAIVMSATYTEPSYYVISLIALLTKNTITIYNYERKKIPAPAKLHLRLTSQKYYARNLSPLNSISQIVREAIRNQKGVHIYTGSKNLAEAIVQQESMSEFAQYISSLPCNLLTSDTEGEFDESKINIGTKFGTGISIKKDNIFILILPSIFDQSSDNYGTFTNGYTSIIQSLARVREGGDIYVYMSTPTSLIKGNYIKDISFDIHEDLKTVSEQEFENEFNLIKALYDREYRSVAESIQDDGSFKEFSEQVKPSFKEYMLLKGHQSLVMHYESFGRNLVPYIIKSSFEHQFCNCTLASCEIVDKENIVISTGESTELENLISVNTLALLEFWDDVAAFKELHSQMVKSVPNRGVSIPIDEEDLSTIGRSAKVAEAIEFNDLPEDIRNAITQEQLDNFDDYMLQHEESKVPNVIDYKGIKISKHNIHKHTFINRGLINILYKARYNKDELYNKRKYIRASIYQACSSKKVSKKNIITSELTDIDKARNKLLKEAYKKLGTVRNRFIKEVKKKSNIDSAIGIHLIDDGTEKMICEVLTTLNVYDHFISNDIYSFLRSIKFHYTDGGVVFDESCSDRDVRRRNILNELTRLFIRTTETSRPISGLQGNHTCKVFKEEIPLEDKGLEIYTFSLT